MTVKRIVDSLQQSGSDNYERPTLRKYINKYGEEAKIETHDIGKSETEAADDTDETPFETIMGVLTSETGTVNFSEPLRKVPRMRIFFGNLQIVLKTHILLRVCDTICLKILKIFIFFHILLRSDVTKLHLLLRSHVMKKLFSGQALRAKINEAKDEKFLEFATPEDGKGLSVSQKILCIAEAISISPETIWKYCREQTKTMPQVKKICDFLGISTWELVIPEVRQVYESHVLDFFKIRDTRKDVTDKNVELIRHSREIREFARFFQQLADDPEEDDLDEHSEHVNKILNKMILEPDIDEFENTG